MAKFNLEEFLKDEDNLDVYHSVRLRKICKTNKDLEWFLGLVTENEQYVIDNKDKPMQTSQKVREVAEGLSIYLKQQFYEILLKLLCYEYDESLHSAMWIIYWDYLSFEDEFKNNFSIGIFLPDSTFMQHIEYLKDMERGQDVYYNENGQSYMNPWAHHKINIKKQKINEVLGNENLDGEKVGGEEKNKSYLTDRQISLFFRILKEQYGLGADVANTDYAKVVLQVSNRKGDLNKIKASNIYQYLNNPDAKRGLGEPSTKASIEDYDTVRKLFITLGDKGTVEYLTSIINGLENQLPQK